MTPDFGLPEGRGGLFVTFAILSPVSLRGSVVFFSGVKGAFPLETFTGGVEDLYVFGLVIILCLVAELLSFPLRTSCFTLAILWCPYVGLEFLNRAFLSTPVTINFL